MIGDGAFLDRHVRNGLKYFGKVVHCDHSLVFPTYVAVEESHGLSAKDIDQFPQKRSTGGIFAGKTPKEGVSVYYPDENSKGFATAVHESRSQNLLSEAK